jgi:hypothetical protein
MAKKVEIELDVKGNVVESAKNLRALKQELKNLPAGTAEWNKIKNDIRDIEDALESAGQSSEDFKGLLENAPGPLGVLGGAIKKVELATKSFGAAFKAIGIGLLVSLIGGLVAAFSQTEGAMKKFEPLLIAMEQIFGGIMEALQPVIDGFIELAIQVMPYVTKAFKVVYSAVTAVFQSLGKLGSAVVKLFKGDFKGAWEDAKSSVTSFSDNYEAATERFEKGAKKMTKTQKANLKDQEDARKAALDKQLKAMEAQDKLDAAKMEKMKAEALALAQTEQEKLDIEKRFQKESYDALLKDIEDKQALYKKGTDEWKALEESKIKLQTENINKTKEFADKQKEITKNSNKELMEEELGALALRKSKGEIGEEEYQEAVYQTKKKYVKDKKELNDIEIAHEQYLTDKKKKEADKQRGILFLQLQDQIDMLDKKNADLDNDFASDIARLEQKKTYLQQQRDLELAAVINDEQKKLEIKKKYGDQINAVEKSITETQKAQQQARVALALAIADNFAQLGNFMQQIAGKNKGLAKAGLIIEQAAGIAKIIINTQVAASKAGYLTPMGIATLVAGALGVATAIAATVKGIRQIDAQDATGGATPNSTPSAQEPAPKAAGYASGGLIGGKRHAQGGTLIEAEQGEAIMTRGAVTMFGPLLSTLNQMGGGTAFNKSSMVSRFDNPKSAYPTDYSNQTPQIIKSYVVEGELTSAQQKQARLKDLSTI